MLVYRYEYPDGGGPWFYRDGTIRHPLPDEYLYIENQEKYLYACDSLESLYDYFSKQDIDIHECTIETYNIPERYIIRISKNQLKFLKKYAE